jgi:hypothetical protein
MKTIIEMARKAGGYFAELPKGDAWLFDKKEQLEAFAELVRADEREACAKACEEQSEIYAVPVTSADYQQMWDECAAVIRARGQA